MKSLYFLSAIITIILIQPTLAQYKNDTLNNKIKQVEKAIEEGEKRSQYLKKRAANLKNDISKAGRDRINIAYSVQNLEQRLSKLEIEIHDLNSAENEKRKLLAARRVQFAGVLMALQRISRLPPEAVIVYPAGATDLIRTAILLKSAVPKIEKQANRLREDLVALAATRDLISSRKLQLKVTGLEFNKKRKILDKLIRLKDKQHKYTISKRRKAASKVKSLNSKVKNLRELFEELEEERQIKSAKKILSRKRGTGTNKDSVPNKTPERNVRLARPFNLKPFALSRGSLRYPAVGRISARYGEMVRRGITHKGLTIETRASAQVVAPHNGKVVFAGNFRGYGQLLIIDHNEGYHSLLAGMARIDGAKGQYLLSGEPVGVMGTPKKGKPSLYIELRRNNQPINPWPWLIKKTNS